MTPQEIKKILPNASKSTISLNSGSESPGAIVERPACAWALAAPKGEGGDSGGYIVRVTSYRTRLLDEDNLSEKYFVDCCRYSGLIPSDAPDKTHIIVSQKKVSKKDQEKTLIQITYP